MKKIAFIVAVPTTAQSFLLGHFSALVKEYEVHLIANFNDNNRMQIFEDLGIKCHTIPIQRKISILLDFKCLLVLMKIFAKERFDSVHSVTPKAGLLTAIAGRCVGIPVRIHIFTGQVWATRIGGMKVFLKKMDRLISLLDNHILVDGESQRRFLVKENVLSEKKGEVLANGSICGVDLERFLVSKEIRCKERQKKGFLDDDVVYIFLGRLNHDKGIGELYEAFNRLVLTCQKAKLLFYGVDEEGYFEKSKSYPNIVINENFFYPGKTEKPQESLQAGDVFVMPSWREGFGSSVIEAQALGLPVITSDAYGLLDASVSGETGLRCRVNDADGLYNCMKEYYEDSQMRKIHGENGRKRVECLFNSKIVTDAWIDFYKRVFI